MKQTEVWIEMPSQTNCTHRESVLLGNVKSTTVCFNIKQIFHNF